MRTYHVYILKCSDGSYYTDFTSDLELQVESHLSWERSETAYRRPIQLVYQREFNIPSFAIAARKQIRRWSVTKQEALINGEFQKLAAL